MSEISTPKPFPAWLRYPLVPCFLVAVALVAIGEAYPFSPLPMYSYIDTTADILLVTNEKDEALPLSRLFNTGSAQLKKRFEKSLKTSEGTRDFEKVDPAQRAAVGTAFLEELWKSRDKGDVANLPSPPQVIRLKIRTVSVEGTVFSDTTFPIAELNVASEGGTP